MNGASGLADLAQVEDLSLLGVVPCALWKPSGHCECGPIRNARLAASGSGVRAVPYPQPTPAPDSTTQQGEQPSTTTAETPGDHCHPYFNQPAATKLASFPTPSSLALPFNTGAALPVIQNPCVIPVEQCYNTNSCLPVGQCYASVLPSAAAARYPTTAAAASAECRCAPDGADCCHGLPYPPTTTSMLFVPYSLPSLPNFPPQYRGNIAVSTSPCNSSSTPIKVRTSVRHSAIICIIFQPGNRELRAKTKALLAFPMTNRALSATHSTLLIRFTVIYVYPSFGSIKKKNPYICV